MLSFRYVDRYWIYGENEVAHILPVFLNPILKA
nr:MAG TPA: hypothetical protein [Caudoviricetes sp.]